MSLLIALSIITVCMFIIAVTNRERYLQEKEEVKKLKAEIHKRNLEDVKQRKIREVIMLHGQA